MVFLNIRIMSPEHICDAEDSPPLTSAKELGDSNSERSSCCNSCANPVLTTTPSFNLKSAKTSPTQNRWLNC